MVLKVMVRFDTMPFSRDPINMNENQVITIKHVYNYVGLKRVTLT